jgi:hypothetical protein
MSVRRHYCTGLFKVLGPDGEACCGGSGRWALPTDEGPGEWMAAVAPILCERGYHLTTTPHLWMNADRRLFVAEANDDEFSASRLEQDKICVRQARLLEEVTWDWPFLHVFKQAAIALLYRGSLRGDLGADFAFSGAFTGGNLKHAFFLGVHFTHSCFGGCLADFAHFQNADLRYCRFAGAQLRHAQFNRCRLDHAGFAGANLESARFTDCDLTSFDFERAAVEGASFKDCKTPEAWTMQPDSRHVVPGSGRECGGWLRAGCARPNTPAGCARPNTP